MEIHQLLPTFSEHELKEGFIIYSTMDTLFLFDKTDRFLDIFELPEIWKEKNRVLLSSLLTEYFEGN